MDAATFTATYASGRAFTLQQAVELVKESSITGDGRKDATGLTVAQRSTLVQLGVDTGTENL